jgi:Rha family phage regulatory protein
MKIKASKEIPMTEVVFVPGPQNEPMVSSREVATRFGKEHRRVLQSVREIMSSIDAEFSLHHFVQSTYSNERGQSQPEILMTKDGFSLLAMGFTGPEAMKWKITFIKAFNLIIGDVVAMKAELARKEEVILRLQKKREKHWMVPDESQPHFEGFEPPLVSKTESELTPEEMKSAKKGHVIKTLNGIIKKHILEKVQQEKADIICALVQGLLS